MDGRALTRLRIAFLLLGAALLLPLGLLLRSVDSRLEAQRRLRHELVAERIFDEMESELTALLAREEARPSTAYDDPSTRVENWAPFVVGYFTRDERGVELVAQAQLTPERLHRLEAALEQYGQPKGEGADAPAAAPVSAYEALEDGSGPRPPREEKAKHESLSAPERRRSEMVGPTGTGLGGSTPSASGAAQPVQPVPEAILKQLNRAADVREREQTRPASKRKAAVRGDDPLSSFE